MIRMPKCEKLMSLALLAIFPFLPVAAQESTPSENILVTYDRTHDVPDEVFLPIFLDHLLLISKNAPRRTAMMRREFQQAMTLSSTDEAQDHFSYLMRKANEAHDEYNEAFRQLICPLTTPRPAGEQVLIALNNLNNTKNAIGRNHLIDMQLTLGAERYKKFLDWMDSKKSEFRIIRSDTY